MRRILLVLILCGILAFTGLLYWRSIQAPSVANEIVALQSTQNTAGFARADHARDFKFPEDHGPHPDYQTEWWYYTGNLATQDGKHFGYQLTFFRRAITPTMPPRASDWATNQIYFAHFAITDVPDNRHLDVERFSRGAAGLAGATGNPFGVWLENWSVESVSPDASRVRLRADDPDIALDLELSADKAPVLHGDNGLSQKTAALGNASYYVSFTRMDTSGKLRVKDSTFEVAGLSWMDHEFGTTGLGPNAAGWDWFSVQLDDGREIMYFQIRNKDGTLEPLSSGTLVESDGSTIHLTREDVQLQVLGTWKSDYSSAVYPSGWQLTIPSAKIDLKLTPYISDQEMRVSFTYWEGAAKVVGMSNDKPIQGSGYVELTGYAAATRGDVGY